MVSRKRAGTDVVNLLKESGLQEFSMSPNHLMGCTNIAMFLKVYGCRTTTSDEGDLTS
jgi:hypothetical protein